MKLLANAITIIRILLSLTLIYLEPLSTGFFAFYLICGMSDILDGYIARTTNTTSRLGEKLDSAADFIMIAVVMVKLYPILSPTINVLVFILIIAGVRILAAIIVFYKYKTFGMLHTYANKAAGFLLFLFPLLYIKLQTEWLIYMVCMVAGVSAAEELVINLISKEFQANRKSLFIK